MQNIYRSPIHTSIGKLEVFYSEDNILEIKFKNSTSSHYLQAESCKPAPIALELQKQIQLYLKGKIQQISIPHKLVGTDFQKTVWKKLTKIPYGKTSAYSDIAKDIKRPKASRAVGMANHHNPLPLIYPCHRVIEKSGKLGGYAGGLELKKQLLLLETGNA